MIDLREIMASVPMHTLEGMEKVRRIVDIYDGDLFEVVLDDMGVAVES
jgi:hypothetical protein